LDSYGDTTFVPGLQPGILYGNNDFSLMFKAFSL